MAVSVRTISAAEHLAYIESQPSVSFLQTPAWGQVKREWRSESVGWFDELDPDGAWGGTSPDGDETTGSDIPEGP